MYIIFPSASPLTSMVMCAEHPGLTFNLSLVRSEPTYSQPIQQWTFVSDFAVSKSFVMIWGNSKRMFCYVLLVFVVIILPGILYCCEGCSFPRRWHHIYKENKFVGREASFNLWVVAIKNCAHSSLTFSNSFWHRHHPHWNNRSSHWRMPKMRFWSGNPISSNLSEHGLSDNFQNLGWERTKCSACCHHHNPNVNL